MWDKIPDIASSNIATGESFKRVTIDDVINTNDNFWKSMHPDYQRIYELGKTLTKLDDENASSIVYCILKSIVQYHKRILQIGRAHV